jgi:heme/copper-type cytochrome/quinol oxidase subunit 4
LGLVHLAASPNLPALLRGSSPVYERAVGPTLLNHVLAGILLLPLGYTTWLAAGASSERWARRIQALNAFVVLTLPVLLVVFLDQRQYYRAPLFVMAVVLVAIISLLTVLASVLLLRQQESVRGR